jgi:hypothetical protein
MRRHTPLRILVLKKIHASKMVVETFSTDSSSSGMNSKEFLDAIDN